MIRFEWNFARRWQTKKYKSKWNETKNDLSISSKHFENYKNIMVLLEL